MGLEPTYVGFANRCLTSWLPHQSFGSASSFSDRCGLLAGGTRVGEERRSGRYVCHTAPLRQSRWDFAEADASGAPSRLGLSQSLGAVRTSTTRHARSNANEPPVRRREPPVRGRRPRSCGTEHRSRGPEPPPPIHEPQARGTGVRYAGRELRSRGTRARSRGPEPRVRGTEARARGNEPRVRGTEARARGNEPRS